MPLQVAMICPDKNICTRNSILKVFVENSVKCIKLDPSNEGFKASFETETDVDKIFSKDTTTQLAKFRCTPLKPGFFKSNCTVIVKNVDKFIMEHDELEIKSSINSSNSDKFIALDVFKFPSGKTFKIEFKSTETANMCISTGLFVLNLYIGPKFLALESNGSVKYCFRCYKMNDHISKNCNKPSIYKACSLCAANDHTYKECSASSRKCLNCNENHATMSKLCPEYKKLTSVPLHDANKINDGRKAEPNFAKITSATTQYKQNNGNELCLTT